MVNDRDVFLARLRTSHSRLFYAPAARRRQPLEVPEALRDDRDVWKALLALHPAVLLPTPPPEPIGLGSLVPPINLAGRNLIPPSFVWDDPEFFVAFCSGVRESKSIAPFKEAVSCFSCTLRNDATLIWNQLIKSMCSGGKSTICFPFCEIFLRACYVNVSRASYEGTILRNNKVFALQVVDKAQFLPINALKAFSKRLANDEDFVLAVVTKRGACLQHASYRLRRQAKICAAACDSEPCALVYCLGRQRRLLRDLGRVVACYGRLQETDATSTVAATPEELEASKSVTLYRRLYKELPAPLRHDEELCHAAFLSGSIAVSDLPEEVQRRRLFWLTAIASRGDAWLHLPQELMVDVEFARAIPQLTCLHLVSSVFDRLPTLVNDRDFWMKIVSSSHVAFSVAEMIENYAPPFVLADKEIIVRAARHDDDVLELLDLPLAEDRDVIEAALQCSPEALHGIEEEVRCCIRI